MLTARRHRYLTRWPRRLAFAVVILLLLAASWRVYQVWQHPLTPVDYNRAAVLQA
jgi:hypothetical protein